MMKNYEIRQIRELLSKSHMFRSMPESAFDAFMHLCDLLTFKPNQKIIWQGEIGVRVFVIVQGEVSISRTVLVESSDGRTSPKEQEQELIRRSSNQYFGEFAMVSPNTPRYVYAYVYLFPSLLTYLRMIN